MADLVELLPQVMEYFRVLLGGQVDRCHSRRIQEKF